MIPKIICFIIGHKRTQDYFTGEYGQEQIQNPITGIFNPVPIMVQKFLDRCPRCGKKLGEEESK